MFGYLVKSILQGGSFQIWRDGGANMECGENAGAHIKVPRRHPSGFQVLFSSGSFWFSTVLEP